MPKAKFLLLVLVSLGIGTALSLFYPAPKAHALSSSNYSSHLIDDSVFRDSGTMSASSIQSFLQKEGSGLASYTDIENCGSSSGSHYSYYKTYYSCGTRQKASKIIYDASRAYDINPRVILATMQKEQSLITTPNPASSQIKYAMGYGCPDSGGCSYAGFFNQVDNGTWQFRTDYELGSGHSWWGYRSSSYPCNGATRYYTAALRAGNHVTFKDDSGTSYSSFTLPNMSTASLYCYTPHVYNNPNGLYGLPTYGTTGQYYSGSYNFVYYFTNWFGSTYGSPFFRVSGTSAVYISGADNTYYHVISPSQMSEYGFGTKTNSIAAVSNSYLSGLTYEGSLSLVSRFDGGAPVYLMGNKGTHYVSSETLLNDYGYTFDDVSDLADWVYDYLNHSTNTQSILKQSDSPEVYLISDDQKQHITSEEAYKTLGSPVYSSRAYVLLDSYVASQLPTGAPILTKGSLTKTSNTNSYGVWNGSVLQTINGTAAKNSGLAAYSAPSSVIGQLPTGGSAVSDLTKSSVGNFYILDSGQKFQVSSAQLSNLGLSSGSFITTSDDFLARLHTSSIGTLIRINGTDPVYDIKSGVIYNIPSSEDLRGLGYSFDGVSNINQTTANLFTNNGADEFTQGRLVAISGQPEVYVITGTSTKMYIPSAQIFKEYGFDWGNIAQVPSAGLSSYTTSGNLAQVVKDSSSTYWLVNSGVKHKISSTMLSSSYYNINTASVPTLSSSALSRLPAKNDLTQYIQAAGDAKVYGVSNGQKHWYTSREAFENAGGSFDQVIQLSQAYVDSLATGSQIN